MVPKAEKRVRNAATLLLRCAIFGFSASGQHAMAAAIVPGENTSTAARESIAPSATVTGAALPDKSALAELIGDADSATKFGLAPVRWGGSVSDILRWSNYAGSSSFENIVMANLRAASYVWQPWIAQITGGIGIVASGPQRSDGNAGNAGSGSSTTLTGNGELALFPLSRFPFRASIDISDSRASSTLTSENTVSKRYALRQDYRPSNSNSSYGLSVERSVLSAQSYGDDVVTSWQGSYSTSFDSQSMEVNLRRTESSRSQGGEGSRFGTYTGRHTYRPDNWLSVESFASLTDSEVRYQSLGVLNGNHARYLQANTFANWRPDEETPLYVTGGARYFGALTDYNGGAVQSQSLSANLAASYNATRNLTVNASGALARTSSAGRSSVITTQGASVSYYADALIFGNSSYSWNAAGSFANQSGSESQSNQAVSGQIGHNLNHVYPLAGGSALTFTAGQAYFANFDRLAGQSQTLTHNGSVSWRVQPSDTLSGATTLSLTDTLTTGERTSHNQFLNWQVNGQNQLSMRAMATANFTLQWSHQAAEAGGTAGSSSLNAYGNLTYAHARAFGVRDLRYAAAFNINTLRTDNRLLGDVSAQRTQVGYSLEQRLEYHIGRLTARLTATVGRLDGKENALLFFQVTRDFGDF